MAINPLGSQFGKGGIGLSDGTLAQAISELQEAVVALQEEGGTGTGTWGDLTALQESVEAAQTALGLVQTALGVMQEDVEGLQGGVEPVAQLALDMGGLQGRVTVLEELAPVQRVLVQVAVEGGMSGAQVPVPGLRDTDEIVSAFIPSIVQAVPVTSVHDDYIIFGQNNDGVMILLTYWHTPPVGA